MFSFLGKMFGTDAAVSKTIETVSNGLDKLYYSEEEKAEDAAKGRSEARSMLIQWMASTSGQNLARRFLAVAITVTWLGMYVGSWMMQVAAVWTGPDAALQLNAAAGLTAERAQEMNGAVMLIVSFYVAAPHMEQIVGKAMDRFGGKK